MDFQTALQRLGFTPIEANIFIILCKHGALTGYEVAKFCGISRSNVYSALYSLLEKGRCYTIEGDTNKYIALSKDELLKSVEREYKEITTIIETNFPKEPSTDLPYITIKGFNPVLNKIKTTLLSCQSHLYLSAAKDTLLLFEEEIEQISQTKNVTIIADQPIPFKSTQNFIKAKSPTGFHMIMDTQIVITGDLLDSPQCLYIANDSLVRLMRESFIVELEIIQMNK